MCDGKVVKDRIPVDDLDSNKIVKLMVGREIKEFFGEKKQLTIGSPVFEVKNLSDGRKIHDISFTVHEREILGFAGLVGAGRTEIMETIFCIRKIASGSVLIRGKAMSLNSVKKVIQQGVSLIPEDRKIKGLAVKLPISSNLNQVSINLKKGPLVHERQFKDKNMGMVHKLNIKLRDLSQAVSNLSGGNQQKVMLAKWLMEDNVVCILDEPTRGIDVATKTEIYELIRELARAGKAVIIVSSEMQELIALCDRIIVINEGRIASEFMSVDATEEKILEKAIAGKN